MSNSPENGRRKRIMAIGMVALLILVAGCSGAGGDASPTPATPEPAEEPEETEVATDAPPQTQTPTATPTPTFAQKFLRDDGETLGARRYLPEYGDNRISWNTMLFLWNDDSVTAHSQVVNGIEGYNYERTYKTEGSAWIYTVDDSFGKEILYANNDTHEKYYQRHKKDGEVAASRQTDWNTVMEPVSPMVVQSLEDWFVWKHSGYTTNNGTTVAVFDLASTKDDFYRDHDVDSDQPLSLSGTVQITENAMIRNIEMSVDDGETGENLYSVQFSVHSIGDTTVEKPDWVESAE